MAAVEDPVVAVEVVKVHGVLPDVAQVEAAFLVLHEEDSIGTRNILHQVLILEVDMAQVVLVMEVTDTPVVEEVTTHIVVTAEWKALVATQVEIIIGHLKGNE